MRASVTGMLARLGTWAWEQLRGAVGPVGCAYARGAGGRWPRSTPLCNGACQTDGRASVSADITNADDVPTYHDAPLFACLYLVYHTAYVAQAKLTSTLGRVCDMRLAPELPLALVAEWPVAMHMTSVLSDLHHSGRTPFALLYIRGHDRQDFDGVSWSMSPSVWLTTQRGT